MDLTNLQIEKNQTKALNSCQSELLHKLNAFEPLKTVINLKLTSRES